MGFRNRLESALGPETMRIIGEAFANTPQGAMFQAGKAIKQERIAKNAPPPPPTELNQKQKEVVSAVANRVLPPAIPSRVPASGGFNPPPVPAPQQAQVRPKTAEPVRQLTEKQQFVVSEIAKQREARQASMTPSATTPAGTRTNKRKSKGGIGAFGMSLINTDLPK
jgi:hypothetical protein